jgi:hypothetical protein
MCSSAECGSGGVAIRRISDLTANDAAKARSAKVCLEAARRRYDEITGFLTRKRMALPAPKCPDPEERPERVTADCRSEPDNDCGHCDARNQS